MAAVEDKMYGRCARSRRRWGERAVDTMATVSDALGPLRDARTGGDLFTMSLSPASRTLRAGWIAGNVQRPGGGLQFLFPGGISKWIDAYAAVGLGQAWENLDMKYAEPRQRLEALPKVGGHRSASGRDGDRDGR
jgi:hypothetical protein